jgi:hypothetical protein
MSKDNSRQEGEEPPEPALGPMGFGILLGAPALYAIYVGVPIAFGGPASMRFLTGPSAFIPIAVYLVLAVVLVILPLLLRRMLRDFGKPLRPKLERRVA